MPQTFGTFIIGTLALAGIFPLAGFWSKDEILVERRPQRLPGVPRRRARRRVHDRGLHDALRVPHVLRRVPRRRTSPDEPSAATPTSSSSTHLADEPATASPARRPRRRARRPHESNGLITGPLWVLSFFAVFVGFINFPFFDPKFETVVRAPRRGSSRSQPAEFNLALAVISVAIALAGHRARLRVLLAGAGPQQLSERNALARAGKHFLVNKYYLDYLYKTSSSPASRARSPPACTGSTSTSSTTSSTTPAAAARELGRFTYEYIDQRGCRRHRQRSRRP